MADKKKNNHHQIEDEGEGEWEYTLFGRRKKKPQNQQQAKQLKVRKDKVLSSMAQVFKVIATQYFIGSVLVFSVSMNRIIAEKQALYRMKEGERELNRRVVGAMALLAAVDYDEVFVSGEQDFKKEAWYQLSKQGVNVLGYDPGTEDLYHLSKSALEEELHPAVQKRLETFRIQLMKIKKSIDKKAEEDTLRAKGINPKYYPPESASGVKKAIQNFRREATGSLGDGSVQAQMMKHTGMLQDLPLQKAQHKPAFKADEILKSPKPF